MTFEERDQVDAERTDAIRETVSRLPARSGTPTLRSPPTVKIIDRAKAYVQQKKGRDRRSTAYPLDGAADPAPAQRPAVSTAHETPEPEPATEPATELATEPATEPAAEPITEPASESVTELATEPATELATEPAAEPITEPASESVTEPATEPTTVPAACPRCGATGEAPCTTPSGKATKTHKGREQ